MKTSSIHIVRRYGQVGGMENYVYYLTKALSEQNQSVTILCEKSYSNSDINNINVIELGNTFSKPRWLSQWGFSRKVSKYFQQNSSNSKIIHSHERTSNHHVTTFHGSSFLKRKKRLLDFLSPRIQMWTYLEKQELLGSQVKVILPNSDLISNQLKNLYPLASNKIKLPAFPGVDPYLSEINRETNGKTIGFLGHEWKRKGLEMACYIINELRKSFPDVRFIVAGCKPDEIKHLFKSWPENSYKLEGWTDTKNFYKQIDLLLHPALAEPFGMVIAEANAAGIPVVISDQCGIASLITTSQGTVCKLNKHSGSNEYEIGDWVKACRNNLNRETSIKPLNLSWDNLASQHIKLYNEILPLITN